VRQCAVIGCKLKQNANEGYNSCASLAGLVLRFIHFIACFILLVIAALPTAQQVDSWSDLFGHKYCFPSGMWNRLAWTLCSGFKT